MLQIFAAVPFVYELREILDWSATATTLRLYDWLKLEVRQSYEKVADQHVIAMKYSNHNRRLLPFAGHQHVAVLCDGQPEEPRPALPGAARPALPEAGAGELSKLALVLRRVHGNNQQLLDLPPVDSAGRLPVCGPPGPAVGAAADILDR
jgi:Piezo non-specific cation channel, R-Ras-binding domain